MQQGHNVERWEDVAPRYRARWERIYRGTGGRWDEREPAYRYGWEMGFHPISRGRSWEDVEPEIRRDWEAQYRDEAAWDEVAEPIRYAWESVAAAGEPLAQGPSGSAGPGQRQHVPVKLYRSSARLTAAAPMPALEPPDVSAEVTADGRLILRGEARGAFKGDKEVLLDEWCAGGYYRELELPTPVDAELGNLTYGNGVVVVALPISAAMRPARLRFEAVGRVWGERVGNAGHPVQRRTTDKHMGEMAAAHAGARRPRSTVTEELPTRAPD
jgi:HSP20 family molecular chaperone IbpA